MSRLYITVYRHTARDDFTSIMQAPMVPPLQEQVLEITHESVMSEPFPLYSTFICILPEEDCHVAFGERPRASNTHLIHEGERLFYGVNPGDRIAVKGASS